MQLERQQAQCKFARRKGMCTDAMRSEFLFSRRLSALEPDLARMAQAAERLGFPSIGDMHSPMEPAFGYNKMQFTVGSDGTRQSSFRAYLPPAVLQARADKLHICTNAIGAKLCLSPLNSARVRAEALLIQTIDGKKSRTVTATKEIVLAAGALMIPQLLLLR